MKQHRCWDAWATQSHNKRDAEAAPIQKSEDEIVVAASKKDAEALSFKLRLIVYD